MIKKLPLQISGLMLALAATGNLFLNYGYLFQSLFGVLSVIILILILMKILIYPQIVYKDLTNPIVASVFPTFPMALMILATYIRGYLGNLPLIIWLIGLLSHIYLILRFTKKNIISVKTNNVPPSYFIVYVGIVIASITSPVFHMQGIGKMLFYFGIICFIILLPPILHKVLIKKNIPKHLLPTLGIFAAPFSIFLAGYLNSFQEKNIIIVYLLIILSQMSLFLVLIQFPKLLKIKFNPSFSALTFPIVISAMSLKLANGYLTISGNYIPYLKFLVNFEEIFSLFIVLYIFFRYLWMLFDQSEVKSSYN